MTELALHLPATDTFDDWSSLGRRLCLGHRKMKWLIGEWLIEGSTRYGDRARDEANAIFRLDEQRLGPIMDVVERYPVEKRHDALTFSHHAAVMVVTDPEQADLLLTEAEQEGMTVKAFRAHVKVEAERRQYRLDHDRVTLPNDDLEDIALGEGVRWWNLAPVSVRRDFVELVEEANLGVIER